MKIPPPLSRTSSSPDCPPASKVKLGKSPPKFVKSMSSVSSPVVPVTVMLFNPEVISSLKREPPLSFTVIVVPVTSNMILKVGFVSMEVRLRSYTVGALTLKLVVSVLS